MSPMCARGSFVCDILYQEMRVAGAWQRSGSMLELMANVFVISHGPFNCPYAMAICVVLL